MSRTGWFLLLMCGVTMIGCGDDRVSDPNDPPEYVTLVPDSFLQLEPNRIADSLAVILDVGPLTSNGTISRFDNDHPVGIAGYEWIKEGRDYVASNGAYVTVWIDQDDRPVMATYLQDRHGGAESWSFGIEGADSVFSASLARVGIERQGSEDWYVYEAAMGPHSHWYSLTLRQMYGGEGVTYPAIEGEVEGATGELLFLRITRWYDRLSEITDLLPEDQLAGLARTYWEAHPDVIEIADSIDIREYCVMGDVLCRTAWGAVIDVWGSSLILYLDVQSGEVVYESRLMIG